MAEFTPINSQEEFDAAIASRLERERAKFSDYETLKTNAANLQTQLEAANAKNTEHETTITGLNAKIAQYESLSAKTRIAKEAGLPEELIERLTGETEDEWKADAEKLAKIFGKKKTPPMRRTEPDPDGDSGKKDGLRKMLADLNISE